jgi:superfamily II DNA or RNA helicase
MLQSLCKDKYPEDFKNRFGLFIADECHRLGATEFSKVMSVYPAKYRIGLSAGMDRKDGTSSVFYLHLGRNVIKCGQTQPKPEIYVFKYGGHSGVIPKYLRQKKQRRGSLLTMLANNHDRNRTLARLCKRLADSDRQTIMISERKFMLGQVRLALLAMGFQDSEVGVYIYETPKNERKRIALECKIILATTKMLSEGTDIDTVRAIIFGTPMSEVLQPIGRIRRVKEGLKTPIVLDFTDIRYKETVKWHRQRVRWYNQQGFKISYM